MDIPNRSPMNEPSGTSTPSGMSTPTSTPTSKNRCFVCQKKLKLVDQTLGLCKCGNLYCPKHRCVRTPEQCALPQSDAEKDCHTCSWDYFKEQQTLIRQQNPNVQNPKLMMF